MIDVRLQAAELLNEFELCIKARPKHNAVDIQIEKDRVTLEAEDKATFGGSSQIVLNFDRKTLLLKGWAVTDPQGYSVTVKLTQIDTKHELDQMNFVVPDTITPIK